MMKGIKKRIIGGMLCMMMIILTACTGNDKTEGTSDGGDDASSGNGKGRYLETDVMLPEGVETVYCMRKLENGVIRMAAENGIFDSKDDGKTFEQSEFSYQIQAAGDGSDYLSAVTLDSQGRMFLAYYEGIKVVDSDGSERDLDIKLPSLEELGLDSILHTSETSDEESEETANEASAEPTSESSEQASDETSDEASQESMKNLLMQIQITSDDKLIGSDISSSIYLIDPDTGEIIRTLYKNDPEAESSGMSQFAQVGEYLVVLTATGIDLYNMETGKLEDPNPAFSSYFSSRAEEGMGMDQYSQIIAADSQGDSMYYGDGTGIYRYVYGAGEMERIINGSLCVMSNPQMFFTALIQKDDDGFLILYQSEGGLALKDYTYSKEASAVPENELKVYALRDSQAIRQAISGFQANNPDYYVSLEVGMSGDDSVTAADAVKTLNTNIMSGKGPDILVTDGLPLEAYMEKGVLADLTDTIEAVKKDNAFFENVVDVNKTDAGQYAIPTRFMLPVVAGDPETIAAVNDLKTLADKVTALRQEDPDIKTIIGNFNAEELSRFMLQLSLNAIWNTDGQIDEDALTRYIDNIKMLYPQNAESEDYTGFAMAMDGQGTYSADNTSVGGRTMDIMMNNQKMTVGTVGSLNDFSFLLGFNKQKSWDYKPLNGLSEQVFIPVDTIAVNAKSSESEKAKEFVKYILSEESQLSSYITGLPVNKDALDKSYAESELDNTMIGMSSSDSEEMVTLEMSLGTKEDLDKFISYLDAAMTAPDSNEIITEAIISAASQCAVDQSDTSEAVNSIQKTVNLYLSE